MAHIVVKSHKIDWGNNEINIEFYMDDSSYTSVLYQSPGTINLDPSSPYHNQDTGKCSLCGETFDGPGIEECSYFEEDENRFNDFIEDAKAPFNDYIDTIRKTERYNGVFKGSGLNINDGYID
ncbi:hypothetical protein DEU47_1135 [Bacillus sp. AG236]|nr:hypothetical protein DEU47_1135 [Bacillus sp. AG236]